MHGIVSQPGRPIRFALGVTALGALLAAGSVRAASVDLAGGVLTYDTIQGDTAANLLTVSLAGGTYTVTDPATAVTPTANALGAGCAVVDAATVTCPPRR